MDTNELRNRILEEARKKGKILTEDEINAAVLEVCKMDREKIDRVSGGFFIDCSTIDFCQGTIRKFS